MARLNGILLLTLLLTACGGSDNPGTSATDFGAGTGTDSSLVAPVQSAPASIRWADTTLSADLYVNPENFIHPFRVDVPAANGLDLVIAHRNNNPDIPMQQQAGAYILLQAAKTGTAIDAAKILQIIAIRQNKAYRLPVAQLHWTDSAPQRIAMTLPNGFTPNQMALQIDNGSAQPVWLAATVHLSNSSFRTYSGGQLTGELPGTAFQPVLQSYYDFSGGAAAMATLLMKAKATLTEKQVMDGLLKYGNADQIITRRGYSFQDFKQYLTALGLTSAGYTLTTPVEDVATLRAEGLTHMLIPVILFGTHHYVILNKLDSQYLYVASPLYGNLAIPQAEIGSVWQKGTDSVHPVLFAFKTPEGWTVPAGI